MSGPHFSPYCGTLEPHEMCSDGKPIEERIVVFSLVKDRLGVTRKSFDSLYEKTKTPFKHIIVDQGSNPRFEAWDDRQVVYRLEENVGISAGTNLALDACVDADIIIKFDNDAIVLTDEAIDKCIEKVLDDPRYVVSPYIEGLVQNKGGAPRTMSYQTMGLVFGRSNHIGGIVTVAHKIAWDRFGRHRTPAPLHGGQDGEFSRKLVDMGFIFGYLEEYKVLHADNEYNSQDLAYWEKRKEEKQVMR